MTDPHLERLIQRQIHNWNRYRELLRLAEEPQEIKPRPIITISRELGSGARELAHALAERLDLQIHGISLIDQIARDKNLEREIVDHLDEQHRSQIDLWVKGVFKQRIFLRDQYHVSLVKAVRTLAVHGGVVIIGRGANIILADTSSLRIRLVAAQDVRIRNVMRYEGIEEDAAREMVAQSDAARHEFIQKMFHIEPNDPHYYDLVINTEHIPGSRLVEIAMMALESRGVFD
jgi:cytidylate kinase